MLTGLLLYLSMKEGGEEEERGLLVVMPNRLIGNLLGLTVALLSASSRANHVRGNSGKSHGFIHIDFNSGPQMKTTGMTAGGDISECLSGQEANSYCFTGYIEAPTKLCFQI